MKKRIFAILLALVLLLGALPVTASAAGSPGYISNVTLGENRSNGGATLLSQWLTYSSLNVASSSWSGSILKEVGKTGIAQVLPIAGYYIPNYYGIPAKGSVYSSDTSMIKDCKFELGNYGSTSDPCLNFTYTVANEGTADIAFKYYYSFDGSNWYIGQASFTIYTNDSVKPEKPDPPTDDDLEHFWHYNPYSGYDEAVFLWCQRVYNHSDSFPRLTDVPGAYTIYEVTENDGSLLTHPNYKVYTPSVYPWMCRVTLDLQKYLDVYNAVYTNTHYLAEGQERYFNLVLFSDGNKWYTVWDSTITAYITCTQPTTEDITLSYADEHGDPITGLPNSQTATVTRGEKASFTVAAGPTCDENKHTFASWNTKADGTGTSYAPGATIELSASATLYAQWNGSGSGGGEDDPKTPVGPGEGESESDSGNIDFGRNQIIVKCVTPKSAEDPTPVHGLLSSPLDVGTIVPGSGKMDETAGTGSIEVYVASYVAKYVEENGAHTKKLAANTVTIPLTWNATTQKWNVPVNTNTTVEVECVTVNPPLDPPPAGPADNDVEGLLNGRTVRVRCATDNTLHTELGYAAKNGLTGDPAKLEGGYTRGEKTHTAYTITLNTDTFVTLYSGTAPTGTSVAHTRNTAQTGETLTWYIYWDGSDWALDTKDEEIVCAVHSTEPETTSYTVHYYLENSTTKVANDRVVSDAKVGEEATETAPTLTGFTVVGSNEQKLTPTASEKKEITFYYKEDLKIDDINNLLNRNKVTVKCVNENGKHAEGYYAPEGTLTKIAEGHNGHIAYTLTAQSKTFVDWYSETHGSHTLKEKQPAQPTELTWTVYWDAAARKWGFTNEATRVLEVEHAEKVTVSFDCHMDGMTIPAQTVQKNAKVTSPGTLTRTGYVFGGWYKNLSDAAAYDFDTPVTESFTLHAKWTPRTDIPYTVKYLEEGTNKELHAAKTGTGTFNTTVQVTAEAISGYTLVGSSPRDLKLEKVSGNELIFYYTKDPVKVSYTVHYYEQGTTTKVAADKVVNNVNAGTEVTEDAISVTGYTAAAPTQQKLNLSATGTNEIIFYYTKNAGTQVGYTVRYLKEGTTTPVLPAYTNTGAVGNSLMITAPAITGYTCVTTSPQTITLNANAALNVITFYYRENGGDGKINTGEPASDSFNNNVNPRQLNRDDHFAYIKGYPDGTVRPEASLTRAEAAAILYRVMEKSCVERFHAESSSFRDVPDGKWYTTYVATLEKAGVIVDSKDGNFRPNDAITRAELASMLAQFANVTGGTNTFSDVPATHWAADYIAAAVRSGWIQGYPDGTFRPEQTIKRAEMTAMVNRALGRDPQSASDLLEGMKTWKDNADPTAWFYLDIQEAANGHTYARKTGGEYWTGLVADVVQ